MSKIENPSLYILQRENNLNTNIYKIGMTTKGFIQRYKSEASYRNCKIVEIREVSDAIEAENALKQKLNINNFKRCKDENETYEGKEDYVVDDYDKFINIFNDVCNEFKPISDSNNNTNVITNKNNFDSEIKSQIDLDFNTLSPKRKLLIDFLGIDHRNQILSSWEKNFNDVFIPIEIIKGNDYHKNKTLKAYLIDYKLMHKLMNNIKRITQTEFLLKISEFIDYDFNKYKGKIKYIKFKDNNKTMVETSGRMLMINFNNIKLFTKVNYFFNWCNIEYDQINENILKQLQKYDRFDYNEIMAKMIESNNKIAIQLLFNENYGLVLNKDCNIPTISIKLKTITIPYNLLEYYQNFNISFLHNPTLEYSIIKQYNILNQNNIEDLFMNHSFLDTILHCLINDYKNGDKTNIQYILNFVHENIHPQNNSNVYNTTFKQKLIEQFENNYKSLKSISTEIKNILYTL